MKKFYSKFFVACLAVSVFMMISAAAAEEVIKMSTTTSTENSGLLNVLLPEFTKDTGIEIKVFSKGTGASIKDGIDGNVDVVFVHARSLEDKFVADGYGAYRLDVMHNDFVIIGPAKDPAGIKGSPAADALKKIAASKSGFVSRGDESGTHVKEQELWALTGIAMTKEESEITDGSQKKKIVFKSPEGGLGKWYYSLGQGMGKTLTFSEEKQAYTVTDRGTYIQYKFGRKEGLDLEILCEGDKILFNPYGILPVNPEKHPHVKFEAADKFAKWLVSEKGQKIIANFKIDGQQAFFPDAIPSVK